MGKVHVFEECRKAEAVELCLLYFHFLERLLHEILIHLLFSKSSHTALINRHDLFDKSLYSFLMCGYVRVSTGLSTGLFLFLFHREPVLF